MTDRLRLAVPNKGRLLSPSIGLLRDAGYSFEDRERALVAQVRNAPVDILFVRTGDVGEFVADGVADVGITGSDLLAEADLALPEVRRLGYGRCRLTVAVPEESHDRSVGDLAGRRIATAHPRVVRRWFAAEGIPVEVVALSGAVEVAPKLGLADAIADLVSSGSTLIVNGLRPLVEILDAEATLVASAASLLNRAEAIASLDLMLGAAVAAPALVPEMAEGAPNPAQRAPSTGAVPIVDPTIVLKAGTILFVPSQRVARLRLFSPTRRRDH